MNDLDKQPLNGKKIRGIYELAQEYGIKEDLEKKVRELFEFGIRALDVYSWNSNQEELEHLLGLCDELKLLPVIGSDFHYQNKGLDPKQLSTLDKQVLKRVGKWIKNGN